MEGVGCQKNNTIENKEKSARDQSKVCRRRVKKKKKVEKPILYKQKGKKEQRMP